MGIYSEKSLLFAILNTAAKTLDLEIGVVS